MAMHSTRCGTGYRHRRLTGLAVRDRRAQAPNQVAPTPNTTVQARPGSRASCGTSIPAIAVPIRACSPSVSVSVASPRRREAARRLAE